MTAKSDVVKNELLRIAAAHDGELKPSAVVAAARPKTSPLHSRFEWNDSEAAERYRLWQARQLIAVTVEYIEAGDDEAVRVFVSLTPDRLNENGGYRSLVSVMSDKQQRAQLLQDSLEEMQRFQEKYRLLHELAKVFAAMRNVSKRFKPKK